MNAALVDSETPGFLAVLMLQTRFPRPAGDVGHAQTFFSLGIEARYQVVPGASPQRVVRQPDSDLLPSFIQAARDMVAQGARMVTTSCGFLARFQPELAKSVPVPFASSSLLWLPRLVAAGESPGVLTIDAEALIPAHFRGAGASIETPTVGVRKGCEFQRRILGDEAELDLAQAERDVVLAARDLQQEHPGLTCIVLECTNMPPFAEAIRKATGLRVEHLPSLIDTLWKIP